MKGYGLDTTMNLELFWSQFDQLGFQETMNIA